MRAGARRQDARPTRPRRGSPRLRGDHLPGGRVAPGVVRRLARVRVDEPPGDLGLPVGGEIAFHRLADDVGPRATLALAVPVETGEEVLGELNERLGPRHSAPYGSDMVRAARGGPPPPRPYAIT